MSHSLTSASVVATATTISAKSNNTSTSNVASLRFQGVRASRADSKLISDIKTVDRRNVTLGLTAVVVGLSMSIGEKNANAAARRPPPRAPEEKKDPNVSGVQAKVLASKKRKEALKDYVAKLREKGKPVNVPPSSSSPSESPSESEQQ